MLSKFIKKNKKTLFHILNGIIVLVSFFYIWSKVTGFSFKNLNFISSGLNLLLFAFVVVLIPVNWLLEAIKWKLLLTRIEKLSLVTSIKSVFAGLTYGILTPARTGELLGRPLYLKSESFSKGVFAASAGSIGQLSVTLIMGFCGIIYFVIQNPTKLFIESNSVGILNIIVSLILIVVVLLGYFNIKFVSKLFSRYKFLDKVSLHAQILTSYSKGELVKVLLISFSRYIVFSLQFFLFLIIFDLKIHVFDAFAGIALTYFVATLIPTATLAEIGIRSSVAMFFLANGSDGNEVSIASSTALVWILNVGIPSLIGGFIWLFPLNSKS